MNYTVGRRRCENANGKLLPGMTATVEFLTGSATNVLVGAERGAALPPTPEELAASGLPRHGGHDTTRGVASGGARRARPAQRAVAARRRRGAAAAQRWRRRADSAAAAAQVAGGAAGRRANGARTRSWRRRRHVIWTLDAARKLKPIRVRSGLSDGQRTAGHEPRTARQGRACR